MGINDEIKEQHKKLKDMSFNEKAEYIWEYYKIHFIVAVFVIILVVSTAVTVANNFKPTYLNAYFINTNFRTFTSGNTLKEDFIRKYNIDAKKYNVYFDVSTYLTDEVSDFQNYGDRIKIDAEYMDENLDVICGYENIIASSASIGTYLDLEKNLPEELLERIKAAGYELYTYDEKDDEGNIIDTYIAGIYVDNSEYLNSLGPDGMFYKDNEYRPVLCVAVNTQRVDKVIELIEMICGI